MYNATVPNKRSPDQTLLAVWCDKALVEAIDACRATLGQDRSQFIRDAIAAACQRRGVKIDQSRVIAPDRSGKGGRRRKEVTPTASVTDGSEIERIAVLGGKLAVSEIEQTSDLDTIQPVASPQAHPKRRRVALTNANNAQRVSYDPRRKGVPQSPPKPVPK